MLTCWQLARNIFSAHIIRLFFLCPPRSVTISSINVLKLYLAKLWITSKENFHLKQNYRGPKENATGITEALSWQATVKCMFVLNVNLQSILIPFLHPPYKITFNMRQRANTHAKSLYIERTKNCNIGLNVRFLTGRLMPFEKGKTVLKLFWPVLSWFSVGICRTSCQP